MIAALAMTATAAVPFSMVASAAPPDNDDPGVQLGDVTVIPGAGITITGLDASVHRRFEVYQVFTGTYDADEGTFSELKWGDGVTAYEGTPVTAGGLVADTVLDNLGSDARAIVENLVLGDAVDTFESEGDTLEISGLADGYYVIKDVTNLDWADDANSAWIVQVAAAGKDTSVAVKKDTPSVDKLVLDEVADAEEGATDGWGESADHAINETFQFKLVATIPINDDLTAYNTYQLLFHDVMSDGVTFENIDSVKITSATLSGENAIELTADDYEEDASTAESKAGLDWQLLIEDVKGLVNANGLGEEGADVEVFGKEVITVEVVYNAHLNENAIVTNESGDNLDVNKNNVLLVYSNNPDNTGTGEADLGETPEDTVWVFTYDVENTKYKVSVADGNELPDAGFTLYTDSAKTTAVKLIDNHDGSYTVANQNDASAITEMFSNEGGIFNIKGLDAGTYYLSETTVPRDYNAADDITITISADHVENAAGDAANLTLTEDHGKNDIVDTKNSSLPSTGGMGTTLFVVGGGVTAVAAGIYLISKKRSKDEDAE